MNFKITECSSIFYFLLDAALYNIVAFIAIIDSFV